MRHLPDLSALTLEERRAWDAAIMAAIAAAETSGGASLIADTDGVSVVLFFPFEPEE